MLQEHETFKVRAATFSTDAIFVTIRCLMILRNLSVVRKFAFAYFMRILNIWNILYWGFMICWRRNFKNSFRRNSTNRIPLLKTQLGLCHKIYLLL